MKITEEEFNRRRERIIETAFRLFCRRGIEHVPIADIAEQARVSESTVYRYFESKPLLVRSTTAVLWEGICSSIRKRTEQTKGYEAMDGLSQIAVQMESCRQLYEENADYVLFSYESKLYLLRNGQHLTQEEYDALMSEIRTSFSLSLKKGMRDGSIPTDRDENDLFYAVWGAVRGYIIKIVIYSALCQKESPWEERYRVLEDGILCALAAGWGHRRNGK